MPCLFVSDVVIFVQKLGPEAEENIRYDFFRAAASLAPERKQFLIINVEIIS